MLKTFWAEASNTVVYILNCNNYTKVVKGMTQEAYFAKRPSAAHFTIFKSDGYVHVPDEYMIKCNPKSACLGGLIRELNELL